MVAWRYGISLLVFNSIPHLFATLTREMSLWTLEEKFHISAHHLLLFILFFNVIVHIPWSLLCLLQAYNILMLVIVKINQLPCIAVARYM